MSVRIEYFEQRLSNVLAYWHKDYKTEEGEKIIKVESFVDTAQDKVIFRVFIDSDSDKKPA